mgnify:CR=1 FL=1
MTCVSLSEPWALSPAAAQRALQAGLEALGLPTSWHLLPASRVDPGALDRCLARLDQATPEVKRKVLLACAAAALSDERVLPEEGEIVRVVAATLGCPVPPLEPAAVPATP